jgi:SNF2 family DNA or RNA helicase
MGLGKTIATLALIAQQKLSGQIPGPTLIVSPLSVLANWRSQVEEHMLPGSLTVFTYQGAARQLVRLPDLAKYDIVLTNYETLQYEFIPPANREEVHEPTVLDAKAGMLWGVNWARIVLDEAHRITSRTSKTFKAICALTATCRLVLTGTPINNRLEDFYAYVAFLRLSPLSHWALFQQTLIRPTKVSQEEVQRSAYARFQRLVAGESSSVHPS